MGKAQEKEKRLDEEGTERMDGGRWGGGRGKRKDGWFAKISGGHLSGMTTLIWSCEESW